MLTAIRFILINTSHPGNIGSAARALKTMNMGQLYLVTPKFFPHEKATELAAGADDVLANAIVTGNLHEALQGCHLIFGTSVRTRGLALPMLDPRQAANKIKQTPEKNKIGILFGSERIGLTNEELQHCHYHVSIPSNPEYGSLNLAQAVQVISYELRMAYKNQFEPENNALIDYASFEELEKFYAHLESVLVRSEFLNPKAKRKLMPRLRRMFNRIQLEPMEVNILRGILKTIDQLLS